MKKYFPIFKNQKDLIYLDSAATTQKPAIVISKLTEFYEKYCANVHRGIYPLSETATNLFEEARKKVAKFINADPEEIIFTYNSTAAMNAIAIMLKNFLKNKKVNILLSDVEHHSNVLPWYNLHNATYEYLKLDHKFLISTDKNKNILQKSFDIASLSMQSNVTGSIFNLKEILAEIHKTKNFISIVDASQAVAHYPIDVKDLNVDFMSFSSHKMYGPFGVGVLFIKKDLHNKLDPFFFGGGMINRVTKEYATWAKAPEKFEAGTPSVADIYSFGFAIEFLNDIGFNKIEQIEGGLRKKLLNHLYELEEIKIFHPPINQKAGPNISFTVDKVHPHDIADFLGKENICVRAGHHCTQILHREVLKIPASVRVSLGIYNDDVDIIKFIEKLKKAIYTFEKTY
jgi:cysteine desulfurase/selenocysteine lyase